MGFSDMPVCGACGRTPTGAHINACIAGPAMLGIRFAEPFIDAYAVRVLATVLPGTQTARHGGDLVPVDRFIASPPHADVTAIGSAQQLPGA